MASLSIQFYATLDELVGLVADWTLNDALYIAIVEFPPVRATSVARADAAASLRMDRVRRVILAERPIDCVAVAEQRPEPNDGALVLELGRLGPHGLSESRLSTTHVTEAWRLIAADLKRRTRAGMVGEHAGTGATAKYRSYRYTPGAARVYSEGTRLRPWAESPVVFRPDA